MLKRGLSTVVTTVIMVLLVMVAVGVVWVVINNIIDDTTEQITPDKILVGLDIIKVGVATNDLAVRVKRDPGQGALDSINFGLSSDTDTKIIKKDASDLAELEERTFTLTNLEISGSGFTLPVGIKEVKVAAVVDIGDGNTATGDYIDFYTTDLTIPDVSS